MSDEFQDTEEMDVIPPAARTPVVPASDPFDLAWDRAVSTWIDGLRGSPISRANNGAWEHLGESMPRLRELIKNELKG